MLHVYYFLVATLQVTVAMVSRTNLTTNRCYGFTYKPYNEPLLWFTYKPYNERLLWFHVETLQLAVAMVSRVLLILTPIKLN